MEKKANVSTGKITGLIVGIVLMVVLFSVAQSVIPTGATAFYNLMHTGLSNTTVLGTGAVSLATSMPGWVGYFWVLGPFTLVITLILGFFALKGRRR